MSHDVPAKYNDLIRWSFGNTPAIADELLALVLEGKKQATCSAHWHYENEHWPLPQQGELSIIVDSKMRPHAVVETTSVEVKRFDEVDARFAYDEGEGDRSYEYWRSVHENFFSTEGYFAPDMKVVCERFRVVEVLSPKEAVV